MGFACQIFIEKSAKTAGKKWRSLSGRTLLPKRRIHPLGISSRRASNGTQGNCRKLLDSCTVSTHRGELFCRNCCTRLFSSSARPASPLIGPSGTNEELGTPLVPPLVATSASNSLSDCCCCCCCCTEDRTIEIEQSDPRSGDRSDDQRLRGGGGGEEEGEQRLTESARRDSGSGCSNLGIVSSVTSLCNPPSSPTAVTTWYNRQHSSSQSIFGCHLCSRKRLPVRPTSTPLSGATANPRSSDDKAKSRTSCSSAECIRCNNESPSGRPGSSCRSEHQRQCSSPRHGLRQRHQRDQQLRHQHPCPDQRHCQQKQESHPRKQDKAPRSDGLRLPTSLRSGSPEVIGPCSSVSPDGASMMQNDYTNENDASFVGGEDDHRWGYSKDGTNVETGEDFDEDAYMDDDDENEENDRMRGGCGGGGGCGNCGRSSSGGCGSGGAGGGCGCSGRASTRGVSGSCASASGTRRSGYEECPPRDFDPCDHRTADTACTAAACSPPCAGRHGCCPPMGCKPLCLKIPRCSPPCVAEPRGCGGGGCCGSGCRGGCGPGGRPCMPLRTCSSPPCQPFSPRSRGSPCSPPRPCAPQPPCCKIPRIVGSRSGGAFGHRSRSPGSRVPGGGGCCGAEDDDECYQPRLPPGCECLGGGLDCQRCGRKVYHAEMQIASGVPYHNICFSCFCCRKPLESLTYQENCGEIYCKQCYIRNFGPQGYGYGAGAGVLQTPM